jgi:ADP-heptose:LPS heptosyltransferase
MDALVLESPAKIGDTLLATPAIRSWKRAHPDAWLTVCCPDHGAAVQVLLHNRHIDALVVVDDDERALLPGRHLRLDPELALGLGRVHGRSFAWGYGHVLGVEIDGPAYDYTILPDEREAAERACAALGGGAPVVLVARKSESCTSNDPTIRAPNKCVDNVHWCHVADGLLRRGFVPVAIGAAGEIDDSRWRRWPGPTYYGHPLRLVAAMCAACAGVLTVDNGIRHLASAAGANVYALSTVLPLDLIGCVPVRGGQHVHEEYVPLPYVTARTLSRGARNLGL